jgi:hypothetical protein
MVISLKTRQYINPPKHLCKIRRCRPHKKQTKKRIPKMCNYSRSKFGPRRLMGYLVRSIFWRSDHSRLTAFRSVRLSGRNIFLGVPGSVADPDPDPDPRVFGPSGSGSGSTSQRGWIWIRILLWIRIRILLSSCKNSKKNLDSSYFVTLLEFLSLKNDVNVHVASKSHKQKNLC